MFKHFPLPFHNFAEKAAEGSECARDQGKFWEMYNKLFDVTAQGNKIALDDIKRYAREIGGIDAAKFDQCIDSGVKAQVIQNDMMEGQQKGVRGTPSFFIGGQQLGGAQPIEVFRSIITQQLGGK